MITRDTSVDMKTIVKKNFVVVVVVVVVMKLQELLIFIDQQKLTSRMEARCVITETIDFNYVQVRVCVECV